MKKVIAIVLSLTILLLCGCTGEKEYSLSNTNASQNTKKLYSYLCETYGNNIISGQQESTWVDGEQYEFVYIYENTGKYPAIRGLDYMNDDFEGVNRRAVEWYEKGGIVSICWHCGADFSGSWTECKETDIKDWDKALTEGTDEYETLVEGMDKGMKIAFAIDATNEYHIASKEGSEYYSESKGEYHFHEYSDSDYLLLTLKAAEGETTWKITDADNNKDDRKYYISDILQGLKLSNRVTTKFSPAFSYPTLFLFTDTANPDRHFVTGSCNENIKWIFE